MLIFLKKLVYFFKKIPINKLKFSLIKLMPNSRKEHSLRSRACNKLQIKTNYGI